MIEGWFPRALISLFLVVPSWMSVPFFHKNLGIRPEVFVLWYFSALAFGVGIWLRSQGSGLWPSTIGCISIILIGLVFGASAHIFLFSAVLKAPNPGVVVAISGAASAVVFVLSLVLGNFFPKYFNAVSFNYAQLMGVLLVISGVFILGWRR